MMSDNVSTGVQPSVHDPGGADFRILVTPSKRKTVKKVFVTISGNFTVKNIREIKELIAPAIKSFDHLTIKLSEIDHIDLSAIQLLHVLSIQDKGFHMNHNLSADQKQLLTIAGFTELIDQPLVLPN